MTAAQPRRYPFGMPRGWFAVAWSDELAPGQVQSLHHFARELVLFRSEAGHEHALDAYCPRLGAHLGEGRVEDGALRCPFHA